MQTGSVHSNSHAFEPRVTKHNTRQDGEPVALEGASCLAERTPGSSEICLLAVWGIDDRLCVSDVVDCGDAPMDDSQLLMDHFDYGAQAVGGAGCSCDNVVLLWVILVLQTMQLSDSRTETFLQARR